MMLSHSSFTASSLSVSTRLPADAPESLIILALQCISDEMALRPSGTVTPQEYRTRSSV